MTSSMKSVEKKLKQKQNVQNIVTKTRIESEFVIMQLRITLSSRNLYIFKKILYTIQWNLIFAVKVEFNSSQPGVAKSRPGNSGHSKIMRENCYH